MTHDDPVRVMVEELLHHFSGPYYVASNDTQRKRVVDEAMKPAAQRAEEIIRRSHDASI